MSTWTVKRLAPRVVDVDFLLATFFLARYHLSRAAPMRTDGPSGLVYGLGAGQCCGSRGLLPCMNYILHHILPPKSEHERMRQRCVAHFTNMYDSMTRWIGPESAAEALSSGRRGLLAYADLNLEAIARNGVHTTKWRLYPKMHLLLHVLEDQVATTGNPRNAWCYADESEIGSASCVAEACHAKTIQKLVMEKYRLSNG